MFSKTDIYKYEVPGHGDVYADPLAIRRVLLTETSGRCWEYAKELGHLDRQLEAVGDAEGETPNAQRAEFSLQRASLEGLLIAAAYEAFRLTPVDHSTGHGITETAALEMLQDYLDWLEKKDAALNG